MFITGKTNWLGYYTRWQKYDDMLSHIDTIPERDRRAELLYELALQRWRPMMNKDEYIDIAIILFVCLSVCLSGGRLNEPDINWKIILKIT